MKRYDELKGLLEKAGKYPALDPIREHADGWTYRCPMCDGSGEIDADHVKEGTETVGGGILTSIVGVQVFGIGDAMQAMEKLVPMAIDALPELIATSEDSARIIAQRDRLYMALVSVKNSSVCAPVGVICDTLWMSETETTVDYIDAALAELDKEKQS